MFAALGDRLAIIRQSVMDCPCCMQRAARGCRSKQTTADAVDPDLIARHCPEVCPLAEPPKRGHTFVSWQRPQEQEAPLEQPRSPSREGFGHTTSEGSAAAGATRSSAPAGATRSRATVSRSRAVVRMSLHGSNYTFKAESSSRASRRQLIAQATRSSFSLCDTVAPGMATRSTAPRRTCLRGLCKVRQGLCDRRGARHIMQTLREPLRTYARPLRGEYANHSTRPL